MYLNEGWTEDDVKLLEKAALEDRKPDALYELGMAYLIWTKQNPSFGKREEGMKMLEESAAAGYGPAATYIGTIYQDGKFDYPADMEVAVRWYKKGADLGDPLGMSNYAVALQHGAGGLEQDDEEAFTWICRAADAGLGIAQYNAALALHAGRGTRVDRVRAKKYFEMAAENGIGMASMWLYSEDYKNL